MITVFICALLAIIARWVLQLKPHAQQVNIVMNTKQVRQKEIVRQVIFAYWPHKNLTLMMVLLENNAQKEIIVFLVLLQLKVARLGNITIRKVLQMQLFV
jgi:hypothetical protein